MWKPQSRHIYRQDRLLSGGPDRNRIPANTTATSQNLRTITRSDGVINVDTTANEDGWRRFKRELL